MHSPLLMPRTEAPSRPPQEPVRRGVHSRDAEPFARMLAEADPVEAPDQLADRGEPAALADGMVEPDPWATPGQVSSTLPPLVPSLMALPVVPLATPSGSLLAEPPTLPKNLELLLPADVHIRVREAPLPSEPLRLQAPSKVAPKASTEASEPGFTQAMIEVVAGTPELDEETVPEGDDLAAWLGSPKGEAAGVGEILGDDKKIAEIEPTTTPELSAPVPQQLRLEIQDSGGRWEMDVLRSGSEVHIEVGGDTALKQILHGATRELEQRLGLHGDTLGSVQWRPISASSSTQNDRLESGDPRSGQEHQARQETPQRQPSRQDPPPEDPDKNHHRGLIHRIL